MIDIVLLGDSVFDSRPYLGAAPDMAERLRQNLPEGWNTTLRAVSGSRLNDLPRQIRALPHDATHLIVSVGGNDVMDHARRFRDSSGGSPLERFSKVAGAMGEFRASYAAACAQIKATKLPGAMCLIYEPRIPDAALRQIGAVALHTINQIISEQASEAGLDIIDLRAACRDAADFFDPIHPSAHGADKIAHRLAAWAKRINGGEHEVRT